MNICMCGAEAGYPHNQLCPRPLYRGSAAAETKWLEEFDAAKKSETEEVKLLKSILDQSAVSPDAQKAIVKRLIENAERRMPVKIPTYDQAEEAVIPTDLDLFVLSNEPAGIEEETMFRDQLKRAIEWCITGEWK
jgi:regulator of extracellular matrix RemA (YlzA/DUF370 family)